jgi:heme-degrading monooxygenase HmoA
MIEIVCEFAVKEGAQGRFELAYGPGGAWSQLFAQTPGFRGTTLLRDTKDLRRYLTIDLWNIEAEREQALVERESEYTRLASAFDEWTESRTEVGVFRVRAEATVYPRGRAQYSGGGEARPRSGRTTR